MNANVPLVTIAMPFYNCEDTLRDSLRSILWQTYQNWELLLYNDGSTDGSLDAAESFTDRRIILRSDRRNRGLAARLNECIALAQGDYFARMDGDDVAYPERLAKQVDFLERHPEVDLLGTSVLVFDKDGIPLGARRGPTSHKSICRKPLSGIWVVHPTFCGRLSWFNKHPYEERIPRGQDQELLLRTHEESCFANIPEILQGFRENSVDLRKTLRGRLHRCKALWCHFSANGCLPSAIYGIALQVAKAATDCIAVSTGTERVLLRHRARPLLPEETDHWRRIWDALNGRNLR